MAYDKEGSPTRKALGVRGEVTKSHLKRKWDGTLHKERDLLRKWCNKAKELLDIGEVREALEMQKVSKWMKLELAFAELADNG